MVKAKILLIDDEIDLVETVKFRLESNDYQVQVAYDGQEALESLENFNPDLVILDLKLPAMSGEEIYKLLKINPVTKKVPVILFTASKEDAELLKIGAEGLIKKPFDSKELLDTIQKLLAKS
jgi:DNA-binding response OmpR family regulator